MAGTRSQTRGQVAANKNSKKAKPKVKKPVLKKVKKKTNRRIPTPEESMYFSARNSMNSMNSAARRRNVNNTASSGRAPTLPPEQMRVLKAKVRELDRKFLENTDRKLKDLGVSKEQRTEIRVVNQAFFTEDPEEALARTAQCGESPPQQTVLHRALKLSYGGTKIAIRGFKGMAQLGQNSNYICSL
jgi:uncharacterized protein YjiS (DUF1127 family)